MKILHLISAPTTGGAELFVSDLARTLVTSGHLVYVGFVSRASDVGGSADVEKSFLSALEISGIKYFFVGHDARKRIWRGAWRVRRFVRMNKIDVYHSHLIFGVVFGALLNIKCVYTHHNIFHRANRFVYFVLNCFVHQYVSISDICSVRLAHLTGRSVLTILNGVNIKRFGSVASVRYISACGTINCLAVGRVQPVKNYSLLINAAALMPAELRARLKIRIAGSGPSQLLNALKEEVAAANMDAIFEFLGDRDDVPRLLEEAQVFLMSSSAEGLPIALLEASVSGLPCVVTDVGGCSEVVDVCKNGFLVEPGDPSAFKSAMVRLLGDPSLLSGLSRNALRFSAVFSIENACSRHLRLYEGLLIRG